MPVQSSAVFPPIVSSHHMYEIAAGAHAEAQPLSSRDQFQLYPGTDRLLNSANDQLSIDSSAALE